MSQAVVGLCGPHSSALYNGTVAYLLNLADGLLGESEKTLYAAEEFGNLKNSKRSSVLMSLTPLLVDLCDLKMFPLLASDISRGSW